MVDKAVLAHKLAAIRDAVARIREVLPNSAEALRSDRTARELVTLNLFLALQQSIAVAAHWLADEGSAVPQSYGETFLALADLKVLDRELAHRLRGAAGLRNLIAHQYAELDFDRIFSVASNELDDLLTFCQQLARRAESR